MKKILTALVLTLLVVSAYAQEGTFKKRYLNHTEAGLMLGRVRYDPYAGQGGTPQHISENRTNLTLQLFNGVQYSPRLGVGVVAGLDWYNSALGNPLGLGVRYDLAGKKNTRLYASADAGYGFTWFHQNSDGFDTRGGLMLNPGLGLRIGKPDGAAFTLSFSYKHQDVTVDKPLLFDQSSRTEARNYNRLLVKMGISF